MPYNVHIYICIMYYYVFLCILYYILYCARASHHPRHNIVYRTAQHSIEQYDVVCYAAVEYSIVWYSAVQYGVVCYATVEYGAIRCSTA